MSSGELTASGAVVGAEVEVALLPSEKGGEILDFYFLLRYCLADTLQIVNIFD